MIFPLFALLALVELEREGVVCALRCGIFVNEIGWKSVEDVGEIKDTRKLKNVFHYSFSSVLVYPYQSEFQIKSVRLLLFT